MTITLLLFASCREAVGAQEMCLDVGENYCVGDLRNDLGRHLPPLAGMAPSISIAVNEEYATDDIELQHGDQVALIPPVSGGSDDEKTICICEGVIAADAHAWVTSKTDGAVVRFEGVVRNHANDVATDYLVYEAYQDMAKRVLAAIAQQAVHQWDIGALAISHRVGRLEIGEISVLITVASPHRAEAFSACRYVIDRIKEVAPIWKKEVGPDGSFWVEGPSAESSAGYT
jgi:molybdopterin converting factor subunit 1